MSAPRPLEAEHLSAAEHAISVATERIGTNRFEARLQILEACASCYGGFDLAAYFKTFETRPLAPTPSLVEKAKPVVLEIDRSGIHPALALSALARETLEEAHRKTTGAYHTDFRLANRIAELAAPSLTYRSKIIDPACGAGILITALTIAVCKSDSTKLSHWLGNGVFAADLSENSLRATLLSLASLTDDLAALRKMRANWANGDSLLAPDTTWTRMAPKGFDAVIGNPPWEKVKLSKHEFLKFSGVDTHYGAESGPIDNDDFSIRKNQVSTYSRQLLQRYPALRNGEPDLYIAFTELFFRICRPGGVISILVPGGLIRSKGTQGIREELIQASTSASFSIFDNRARFFSIDSRFKFLAVCLIKEGDQKKKREPISLIHERGTRTGVEAYGHALIGRNALAHIRPDLTIPEVRSSAEWKVFLKISESGCSWHTPGLGWTPSFCREVDMTKERPSFLTQPSEHSLPVVEGRMVQQHRFGVKGYVSGTGRRAIWQAYAIGNCQVRPQFWIEPADVPAANRNRLDMVRVGFCDIAGQTNERSLMAAIIPEGVVCGNKVPTIVFPEDPSIDRLYVWTAVANSFVFDWMLRRVLTTTVNYFLLQSIPLPRIAKNSLAWKRLASRTKELQALNCSGIGLAPAERAAQIRGEIDAEVAIAYGLNLHDMELILQDFPILDRGQKPLPGEERSTVTRDLALMILAKRLGEPSESLASRVEQSLQRRAIAYMPSEISRHTEEIEE